MLNLIDLIKLTGRNLQPNSIKIHCATPSPGGDPMDAYLNGQFQDWQSYQSLKNFPRPHVLGLIQRRGGGWLFAGVWDVLGHPTLFKTPKHYYLYSLKQWTGLEDLDGRVIISFCPPGRQRYLKGENYSTKLQVDQILPAKYSQREFPGFPSVLVRIDELRRIFKLGVGSWRSALQSVSGIYVICDTSCGRHYVGSAYGVGGIWGRWSVYAGTNHGGNDKLIALLNEKGAGHADHFQFSILEILDPMTPASDAIRRENHWKQALGSVRHGYNSG